MTLLPMVQTLSGGAIGSALRRITRDDAPEHRVEGRPVGGRMAARRSSMTASGAWATLLAIDRCHAVSPGGYATAGHAPRRS